MRFLPLLAALLGTASAQNVAKGFNYGSTFTDGSAKQQADFEAEFSRAQNLDGASGFTSARLYTMIQAGTPNTPISAIPAAIDTQTTLLLGLWGSAGQANFQNELDALTAAINQYGTEFTDLIVGISVGSEDLYRVSPTGIENDSGAGANPQTLVDYVSQVRSTIAGTAASSKSIGHVDTWTAWVNGSNNALIEAVDWLGMDAYPYFQNTISNGIDVGNSTFFEAYDATVAVSMGKPVWVTETGWPVSGPQMNEAVASVENSKTFWDETGCALFGNINTWWFILKDALPTTPNPSFGIIGAGDLSQDPLYDLSCPAGSNGAASSAAATSTSVASSAASPTMPGSTATSGTVSVIQSPGSEIVAPSTVVSLTATESGTGIAISTTVNTEKLPQPTGTIIQSPGSETVAPSTIVSFTATDSGTGIATSTAVNTEQLPQPTDTIIQSSKPLTTDVITSAGASETDTIVSIVESGTKVTDTVTGGQTLSYQPPTVTLPSTYVPASPPPAETSTKVYFTDSSAITKTLTEAPGSATLPSITMTNPYHPSLTTITSGSLMSSLKGTETIYSTTFLTITSCPNGCPSSMVTLASPPADKSSKPAESAYASGTYGSAQPSSTASASSTGDGKSCPANLDGDYEFPHLILPVSSAHPHKAYGTSYNGHLTPTISSIFNFDLPTSYAGKTCSLVFLFPKQEDLETSSFTFNGKGGFVVNELKESATEATTYETVPEAAVPNIGSVEHLENGQSYVVASHECAAGARQSFEFVSTGGLELEYFQDYNPSPIGAYITVC